MVVRLASMSVVLMAALMEWRKATSLGLMLAAKTGRRSDALKAASLVPSTADHSD